MSAPTPIPAPQSAPIAAPSRHARRLALGESFIGENGLVPFGLTHEEQSTVLNVFLGHIASSVKAGEMGERSALIVREGLLAGMRQVKRSKEARK